MKGLPVLLVVFFVASLAIAAERETATAPLAAAAAGGALGATAPGAGGGFTVQSWYFRWTVVARGVKAFAIEKTDKGVRTVLIGQIDSIWIPPASAREIGDVLAKTDDYAKKLQARAAALKDKTEPVLETVPTKDCTVTFRVNPTYGFVVSIRHAEGQANVASVLIDQADADALYPAMQKAEAMAAYIDKKINP